MTPFKDIELLRINYLRGPNIWTYRPALEVWLDLGALEGHPSHQLAGFNDRLTTWLPALIEHHCGVGERGGFLPEHLAGRQQFIEPGGLVCRDAAGQHQALQGTGWEKCAAMRAWCRCAGIPGVTATTGWGAPRAP